MIANRIDSAIRDQRLAEVIAAYLEAGEGPDPPQRQEWLARYPQMAAELEEFFAGQDQLDGLVKPLQPLLCPSSVQAGHERPSVIVHSRTNQTPSNHGTCFVGDYELLEEIARGGMGVVYRARQISLNRIVALKLILAGQFASGDDVERFRREAVAAANLDHPNIVPVYEVGEAQGQHYFSMKLIEGGNLAGQALRYAKEQRATAQLLATVSLAVHHAHQRGLLHRDLKPANILLDEQGQPHISDFGLAKSVSQNESAARSGSGLLVGTPNYMAPEQAAGTKQLSTAADIYSLGVILYELLAGCKPFRAETPLAVLMKAAHCDPLPPRRLNNQLDCDLETICLKCLEKDPQRRYGSALALAEDLEQWLKGEPIRARSSTPIERSIKWARRRPASAALAGVSVLAGLVIVALLVAGHVRISQSLASLRGEQQKTSAALLQEREARKKALEALLENARLTTDALRLFNEVYASEVVERMQANGIEATHDYAGNPGAIPLPGALSGELAKRITSHCHGKEIRIYSDYSFPWNAAEGGPRDRFEQEALVHLRQQPEEPFFRFEEYRGRPALRYATAVRILPTCVTAHNALSRAAKADWQQGEVSGVYEVILPVDDAVAKMALLEE